MNAAFFFAPALVSVTRFSVLVTTVVTNLCDVLATEIFPRIPPLPSLVRPPRPRAFCLSVPPTKPPFEPSRVILHGRLALRRLS